MRRFKELTRKGFNPFKDKLPGFRGPKSKTSTSLPIYTTAPSLENVAPQVLVTGPEGAAGEEATQPSNVSAHTVALGRPTASLASTASLVSRGVEDPVAQLAEPTTTPSLAPPADAKDPSGSKQPKGAAWSGLKRLFDALESSADVFGPLKSAIGGLNRCIDAFESASKGREDYETLRKELDQLLESLAPFRTNMGQTGEAMTTSVKNLCSEIEAELKIVKEKQTRNALSRHLEAVEDSDDVLECYRRIHGHIMRLKMNVHLDTSQKLDEVVANARLDRLSPAKGCVYNSGVADAVQRGPCAEGTRESELKKLVDWADHPSGETIYWLNGMAGTGKTTITYSLCDKLETTGKLAASFFCSRSIPSCRDVHSIIPTIAYQLARFSYPFKSALCKALESEPDASTKKLEIQFQNLIIAPLKEVQHALPSDFVVVTDALDECEDTESTRKILSILVRSSMDHKLPVRFLISSRPEPPIYDQMMRALGERRDAKLVLHELDPSIVQKDIEKYLRGELRGIPITPLQWPELIRRCGVLFIYAATACRYIKDGHDMQDNGEALNTVLGLPSPEPASENTGAVIDSLYITILRAAFEHHRISKSNKDRMKKIMHTVICAREPMTTATLAELLQSKPDEGMLSSDRVNAILQPLRSVIHVADHTKLVTTLHASFPNFILSSSRSGHLCCCPSAHHEMLALECLRAIRSNPVQFNICDFRSSHALDAADIQPQITQRSEKDVSPTLSYACRYWAAHLCFVDELAQVQVSLYDFLTARLLLWMEVLNVTGYMQSGVGILTKTESWCRRMSVPQEIEDLVHDAQRFVSLYASHPVSQSTAHIYISMLAFWSNPSPIAKHYVPRTSGLPWPEGSAVERRSSALLFTMAMAEEVNAVCYSLDGIRIIAAAGNNIYVLDGQTAQIVFGPLLEGHTDTVTSVADSPNGSMIASGSHDSTVLLWNAETWERAGKPLLHTGFVNSVGFSPDSTRLVSVDYNIYVWSTESRECVFKVRVRDAYLGAIYLDDLSIIVTTTDRFKTEPSRIVILDANTGVNIAEYPVGFKSGSLNCSPDGSLITVGGSSSKARVWNFSSRGLSQPVDLSGHTDSVQQVVFSHCGSYIASGSIDRNIRVWHADGRMAGGPYEGHAGPVDSVAFSRDGSRIVSGSRDRTVRIWDVRGKDTAIRSPENHTYRIHSVCFSRDGSQLVTGADSGKICLWDVRTGKLALGPLAGHTQPVYSVDISPDGSYIASASYDRSIRLWNLKDIENTCKVLAEGVKEPGWVKFTANNSRIVCGPKNAGCSVYTVEELPDSWPVRNIKSAEIAEMSDAEYFDLQPGRPGSIPDTVFALPDGIRGIVHAGYVKRVFYPNWDDDASVQHIYTLEPIALSPCRRYAASGSNDGEIYLWDVQSGRPLNMIPLKGHTQSVRLLQFSPDGSRIVSCSDDGAIRLWSTPSQQELEMYRPADTVRIKGPFFGQHPFIKSRAKAPWLQEWALDSNGWVVNQQGDHLIWVPHDLQKYLLLPRNELLISDRGSFKLDFEGANIGESWTKCYTPVPPRILNPMVE